MTVTKKVLQVFGSPHSMNVWGNIETLGWRKVQPLTPDGCTNMFSILVAARTSGLPVTATLNASNEITILYL